MISGRSRIRQFPDLAVQDETIKSRRNILGADRFLFFSVMLVMIAAMSMPPPAVAGIYTFTDSDGVIHFTTKASDPRYENLTPVPYPSWPVRLASPMRSDAINRYESLINSIARDQQMDRALLHAVIAVESDYNHRAVSRKGAKGLMQLMPETARRYGVTDIFDPAQNIQAGARHLRELLSRFNNDLSLALAAYNAGEDAIVRYGHRIPPFRETRQYVPRVLDIYHRNRSANP